MLESSNKFDSSNTLTIEKIKERFDSTHSNNWILEEYPCPKDNISADDLLGFVEDSKIILPIVLLWSCNIGCRPVTTFYDFTIRCTQVLSGSFYSDATYQREYIKFIDPILKGDIKGCNQTSIAKLFSGEFSRELTADRLEWLKDIEFCYLSDLVDAWLGSKCIEENYSAQVVSKFNFLDFDIIMSLRDILKRSYLEMVLSKGNDNKDYFSSSKENLLKTLCDVRSLDKIRLPKELVKGYNLEYSQDLKDRSKASSKTITKRFLD